MAEADADLALIGDAAREAGERIMGFYGRKPRIWDKGGNDPVSEADLAAEALLEDRLRTARPDYGWLSEEAEDDGSRLTAARSFIVDPLDGTRAFVKQRDGEFVVSVGLVENGRPIAGAVYEPAGEVLYAARRGGGAFRNGEPIRVSDADSIAGARILGDPGRLSALRDLGASAHTVNSIALRLALVAEGRYDAVVAVRGKWDWDLAAGHVLIEEAGGLITSDRGEPLAYDAETPRRPPPLAAGRALHALLLQRLSRET
ncbi:3'(2'),5'-bisphosphate nucleotidase CysQ [Marinicauda salina]|uniref:3'(2'),5'-bisphosphate nucleotidase CysQ n=1 Tax=Marinicauda salina TaxID=2135793 RepID=A0A2U2BUK2_9PROT|nr:3'(2'),5'-bisphosphate nucleotidase CysQ [Marinicauda salina]PWE17688.1 3'(2'),5'-bisphosphate nucleotidase CysQ [Marinicauda salina]